MTTTIYAKIAKVMDQVKRVPKTGYNSFHKYNYATETDLTESIRPILTEAGLAYFSSVLEQSREGEFTKVKMEFTIADIETGVELKSTYWGEGQDKGDKGLYKAYTGATKYFLMKSFLIPTGDDPEGDTGADERNHAKPKEQPKKPVEDKKKSATNELLYGKPEIVDSKEDRLAAINTLFTYAKAIGVDPTDLRKYSDKSPTQWSVVDCEKIRTKLANRNQPDLSEVTDADFADLSALQ